MIQALKSLFSPETADSDVLPPSSVREERLKVATCVVLLEMAMADDEFTAEERTSVDQSLRTRFALTEEDANKLIELATEERKESKDLWAFTHQINDSCNHDEKLEIIDEVWRVVVADGSIDGHENHLAHQLAKLFNLTHGELIESKTKILKEARNA